MQSVQEKYKNLQEYLKSLGSVAVAFSSGVDSTFLLAAAKKTLGADHVIAVTASSCSFPKRELEEAKQFCKEQGIRHIVCKSEELDIEDFVRIRRIVAISANMNCLRKYWKLQKNIISMPWLRDLTWMIMVTIDRDWSQLQSLVSKVRSGGFVEQRRDPYTFQRDGTANLGQAVICMPFLPVCLWGDNFRRKTRHGG